MFAFRPPFIETQIIVPIFPPRKHESFDLK
jgi:hypothetical protein